MVLLLIKMAFARLFGFRATAKKAADKLTPEEFRDKYFQMTAEDIKTLTQHNVSCINSMVKCLAII